MKIKHVLLTLSVLLYYCLLGDYLYGQEDDDQSKLLTDIFSPAPSVAALGKFTDIPVGHHTGLPNISIPLGEIKSRSLRVPIGISYHASGIKVEEVAGWVGTGWALNGGGVISRTMIGKPDETAGVGYFTRGKYLPRPDDPSSGAGAWEPDTFHDKQAIAEGTWDVQPDVFTFNFNGRSGKFIFYVEEGKTPEVRTVPYQNIKIIPEWNKDRWTIITEDGTQYIFGLSLDASRSAVSRTMGDTGGDSHYNYKSAWHLLEMIAPNSTDKIDFFYDTVEEHGRYTETETQYYFAKLVGDNARECDHINDNFSYSYTYTSPGYKLKKIEAINSSLRIDVEAGRADMKNNQGCRLKKINFLDETGALLKQFELYHSYFLSEGTGDKAKRLRLDSLREFSSQLENLPAYQFKYYNDDELPRKDSKAQDHWGFYNGIKNSTKVPEMIYNGTLLAGADREPNHKYSIYGVLDQIIYPTGGEVSFKYEGHDYGYQAGNKVCENATQPNLISHSLDLRDQNTPMKQVVYHFTNDVDEWIEFDMNWRTDHPSDPCNASVTIDENEYNTGESIYQGQKHRTTELQYLKAGEHTLILKCDFKDYVNVNFSYTSILKNEDGSNVQIKSLPAGGVRVKQITTYDGISHDNDIVTEYDYGKIDEPERSSGHIYSPIKYNYKYYKPQLQTSSTNLPPLQTGLCEYFVRCSGPVGQTGSSNGSHVGYSQVTERHGHNGANGKTEYYYTNQRDIHNNHFPFAPPISYEWKRGHLWKKIDYDAKGNMVRKEENNYVFKDLNGDPNRKVIPGVKGAYSKKHAYQDDACNEFIFDNYYIESAWMFLQSKTITEYVDGKEWIQIKKYTYDENHIQMKESVINNSEGGEIITKYYYPEDASSTELNSEIKNLMLQKHMIATPVKQEVFKQKTPDTEKIQIGGSYTEYGLMGPELNLILPHKNKSYEEGVYVEKLIFDQYDAFGNLLQYHKQDDITVSIKWGYNHQFPILKAENANYEQIRNYIQGEAVPDLPKSFLTTYTYQPGRGITSQTDSNGVSTYYEYDNFGRLISIKDQDGNILKYYEYHYQK